MNSTTKRAIKVLRKLGHAKLVKKVAAVSMKPTIRKLVEEEPEGFRDDIRHARGRKIINVKVGTKVKYKGKDWFFYDADADASAPGKALLILVSTDFTKLAEGIPIPDTSLAGKL
jgi:hypothetical protein